MDEKLALLNDSFNSFLDGGLEKGLITAVYGPASSGKTTFCMISAISSVKTGKKVLIIDTERGFSISRLSQLNGNNTSLMNNLLFFRPVQFEEQIKLIENLENVMNKEVGLIIVDTINFQYRLEIAKKVDVKKLNNKLISQIGFLQQLASKFNIPVLLTSQVYSSFEEKDKVNLVGGEIIRFASKCIIELKNDDDKRIVTLEKHRSLPNKSMNFKIVKDGFTRL